MSEDFPQQDAFFALLDDAQRLPPPRSGLCGDAPTKIRDRLSGLESHCANESAVDDQCLIRDALTISRREETPNGPRRCRVIMRSEFG